jgi:hypothetical protein
VDYWEDSGTLESGIVSVGSAAILLQADPVQFWESVLAGGSG